MLSKIKNFVLILSFIMSGTPSSIRALTPEDFIANVECASISAEEAVNVSHDLLIRTANLYGSTLFLGAAKNGYTKLLERLLNEKELAGKIVGFDSLLCHAIAGGSLENAILLIRKGAGVNTQERHGQTALHLAVKNKNEDFTNWLLSCGAKTDIRGKGGTPFHFARGNLPMMLTLLEHPNSKVPWRLFESIPMTETPLFLAIQQNDLEAMKRLRQLAEKGISIGDINRTDRRGFNIFHWAVILESDRVKSEILRFPNFSPEIRDDKSDTSSYYSSVVDPEIPLTHLYFLRQRLLANRELIVSIKTGMPTS